MFDCPEKISLPVRGDCHCQNPTPGHETHYFSYNLGPSGREHTIFWNKEKIWATLEKKGKQRFTIPVFARFAPSMVDDIDAHIPERYASRAEFLRAACRRELDCLKN